MWAGLQRREKAMRRGCLLLALLCIATNAGAVAFAEVRITHITQGTRSSSDPAHQTITSSVDTDEVLASVTAGPAPNVQVDRLGSSDLPRTPAGTVKFIEMTYVLTAWDDGLVASGPLSSWCSPSSPHFSTPPFCVESLNGYEVAGQIFSSGTLVQRRCRLLRISVPRGRIAADKRRRHRRPLHGERRRQG